LLAWKLQTYGIRHQYELVGFVDDDPRKLGMKAHGLMVLGDRTKIPELVAERDVTLIVVAVHTLSGQEFRDILSICHETSAQVKVLPDDLDVIDGGALSVRLKDPVVEDLLGRDQVETDLASCRAVLTGRTVLVTGAGGSIGSELCRQILRFSPRWLLMLDNNETALHDLEIELAPVAGTAGVETILADILRREKMDRILRRYHPQVIFHSAAFKHVHKMEEHPDEAVWVNIQGTRILSELAKDNGVERFVFISTDKAVNPSSVMGISKYVGELLVTTLAPQDGSLFTAVRFGNVLGSRGSVVPTFNRQIEQGGPVTITHPEARRFFMTLEEAASLVIQAAALTEGGDIFVLDMGQEIKIEDLATRMIRLRGLRVGKDVEIEYVGLRPGEKLREDLVGPGEAKEPTAHPKIARVVNSGHQVNRSQLLEEVDALVELASAQRNGEIVSRLRANSVFVPVPVAKEMPPVVSGHTVDH
ncbi:MAG: nucleoside-diphosphate sugar epimerase/dehydratase, partial [Anaerolineae bacterium]